MSLQEIQTKLNAIAQSEKLSVQVNQAGKQLTIVLNRPPSNMNVDYSQVAKEMLSVLQDLHPEGVTGIKFYGREKGGKQAEWQESHSLDRIVLNTVNAETRDLGSSTQLASSVQISSTNSLFEKFKLVQGTVSTLALLGILGVLLTNSFAGQKVQTVSYEYRIEAIPDLLFDETMNELGEDGWELVVARRAQNSITDEFSYECIFKKVK
jgi:hypothetical protein